MRNVSLKSCTENRNTHFMFNLFFFFLFFPSENRVAYEIMWKNTSTAGKVTMTIWFMLFAYWIPKATQTHSEYVILTAFPLKQRLHTPLTPQCYVICRLPVLLFTRYFALLFCKRCLFANHERQYETKKKSAICTGRHYLTFRKHT